MTEKIARRGVSIPDSYEPDILSKLTVGQAIDKEGIVLNPENKIQEVREWIKLNNIQDTYFVAAHNKGDYIGTVKLADVFRYDLDPATTLNAIVNDMRFIIKSKDSLRTAVEMMAKESVEVLPVLTKDKITGVLSYKDIVNAYNLYHDENEQIALLISLKRQRLKILIRGKELFKANQKVK